MTYVPSVFEILTFCVFERQRRKTGKTKEREREKKLLGFRLVEAFNRRLEADVTFLGFQKKKRFDPRKSTIKAW